MYTVMHNDYPYDVDMCFKNGNYFSTKEEAEILCEKLTTEYAANPKHHKEKPFYVIKIA